MERQSADGMVGEDVGNCDSRRSKGKESPETWQCASEKEGLLSVSLQGPHCALSILFFSSGGGIWHGKVGCFHGGVR